MSNAATYPIVRYPNHILQWFDSRSLPSSVHRVTRPNLYPESLASVGSYDRLFADELRHVFKNKIVDRYAIIEDNTEKFYKPDIVYADPAIDLYVDIEIDEPYYQHHGEAPQPTHYLKRNADGTCEHIDEARDEFFTNHGWLVIRFSEQQARANAIPCVLFVKDIIDSLKMRKRIDETALPYVVPQWTEEDARRLMDKSIRGTRTDMLYDHARRGT